MASVVLRRAHTRPTAAMPRWSSAATGQQPTLPARRSPCTDASKSNGPPDSVPSGSEPVFTRTVAKALAHATCRRPAAVE